jgi:hypothetical protein
MKNIPALITLTALAALVLLAVVSSVVASVPFMPIAAYIVSTACSSGLVGIFLNDYSRRTPQIDLSPEKACQPRLQPSQRQARAMVPAAPRGVWAPRGIRNDPATLSYS